LQIPIALKYYFPLGKSKFNLFAKTGIAFGIPLQKLRSTSTYYPDSYPERSDSWIDSDGIEGRDDQRMAYYTMIYAPRKPLNILLNAGFGFAYTFDFGLGLSVYTEYYTGVMNMAQISIHFRQEQYEHRLNEWESYDEGVEYVNFRGDYWNVGLGVSYTFKQKKNK
jgi:hypothetical protein